MRTTIKRSVFLLGVTALLLVTMLAGLTPPAAAQPTATLTGKVSFMPEYASRVELGSPWRVVVLLDLGGAMSLNFAGQGVRAGETIQCAPGQPGGTPARFCGWSPPAWPVVEERRIFVARALLASYIQNLNLPGAPGYDSSLPPDQVEIVPFTHGVSYNPAQPWGSRSSDLAALTRRATNVGAYKGDPYRTVSFSNPAAAFHRAGQILARGAPTTSYQGREFTYEPQILLISSGMATHLLDPAERNLNGELSGPRTYVLGNPCATLGVNVIVTPLCMTTEVGGQYTRRRDGVVFERPFTELVNQARQLNQAQIHVVQLGTDLAPGLAEAASNPDSYFQLDQPDIAHDTIAGSLTERELIGSCVAVVEPWTSFIPRSRAGENYPQVGEATLVDTVTGTIYTTPVMARPDATLQYEFSVIPPGVYNLGAYIFYRHPVDDTLRIYNQIFLQEQHVGDMVTVNVEGGTVRYDLGLKFYGHPCVAP